MKKLFSLFLLAALSTSLTFAASTGEPSYCSPEKFAQLEIKSPLTDLDNRGLQRMHAFRVGKTTLVGLAVGDSKTPSTQKLATTFSSENVDQEKYCTWYFATKNKTAYKSFIPTTIQNPFSISVAESAEIFMSAMQDSFFQDQSQNFVRCARDHKYIAMGCTQQRHRGPTVFGMMLAFSGCTPDHANTIVNKVWGLNGLKPDVRLEAIKAAYNYGNQNETERSKFVESLVD